MRVEDEATCVDGHRFRVVDGIPILLLDDADEVARRQHEHQREFYDREFSGTRPYRIQNWQRAYLRRIEPLWEGCGEQDAFLDAGAGGDAYTVIEAARRGIPSVGCDLSLESMRTAKRFAEAQGVAARCMFVVATVETLPFADQTFGAVAGVAVLEHVPDDEATIAEVARVVRPGGQVYFTVPNTLDDAPLLLRPFYRRHDRWVGHLRHYSSDQLELKCGAAGLRHKQTLYTAHWEKVVQLGTHLVLSRLGVAHDRLWWWLEKLDARHGSRASGLHLHMILVKP
jgi:ubiquinone/menaquinone biosynthesis C-methylase UbiE